MAEKKVNKSEEIRKYLADHPDDGPKAIQKALAEQGIEVTEALVSNVKYHAKNRKAKTTRKK